MNKKTIKELLRLNLNVSGYRACVVLRYQGDIDEYVEHLCNKHNIRYFKQSMEIKNVNNDSRIRFITPNYPAERIMGMKIDHVIVDDVVRDDLMVSLIHRVRDVDYVVKIDG